MDYWEAIPNQGCVGTRGMCRLLQKREEGVPPSYKGKIRGSWSLPVFPQSVKTILMFPH